MLSPSPLTVRFALFLFLSLSLMFPEKSAEPLAAHKVPASPQAFVPLCAPAAPAVALVPSPCKTAPAHASPPTELTGHVAALKNTSKPAALPTAPSEPSAESEEEKAKKLLYCSLCKVAVNSLSQLEAHNTGVANICLCITVSFP